MYKVFISDKLLIIASSSDKKNIEKSIRIIEYTPNFNWDSLTQDLGEDGAVVVGDEEKIWNNFRSNFKEITAAGGVVQNEEGEVLFIFRNGKWDLPKGKTEIGETIEETAIREVEEECGLKGLIVEKPLHNTYHIYQMNGERVLKTTYWYMMKTNWDNRLVPQLEEGITKVEWLAKDELEKVRENSYRSIVEFLNDINL